MNSARGIVIWFIATLFVIYAFCLNTAAAVFSPVIQTSLHASNLSVAIAMGTFILGFACMQIPAGFLLDTYDAKWVVSAGVLLLAIGNLLVSFTDNIVLYALSNGIQGMGASFAFIAAAVLIAQWFSEKTFPILFGLTQTLSCILSALIHYGFIEALVTHPWNVLYRDLAGAGFVLAILSICLITSPPNQQKEASLSLKKSLSMVLHNKQMILCALAAATSFGVVLAYAGFWYTKVETFYAVSTLNAAITSGMIFFGIGVGTPILGWISNHFNSRVMIIHVSLCLGTMALILGIYLPHFQIKTLIITRIVSFMMGFFLSGAMLLYTVVSEISTNATRGVAISVTNTAVFLFNTVMLFSPYLFLTLSSTHFYTYLWIMPFFLTFSILLLYFIKDSFRPEVITDLP